MYQISSGKREHAVVIGASIAGVCAARVLSDFYSRVTVYDRDTLPEAPAHRSAVPQGRHVHILMARGAEEFGALFPGLLDDLVRAGVPILKDQPHRIHFGVSGHVLGIPDKLREQFTTYVPSRSHLEWQIRRHAAALPNVTVRRRAVDRPCFDGAAQRVTGVLAEAAGGEPEFVNADVVVDATGRGSRLPVWLAEWGFERPPEDTVDVGIAYATQQIRIPAGLIEESVVVAGASRRQSVGLGMLRYEDGTWDLTTFGVGKAEPPHAFAEMCAVADQILPARFAAAIRAAEPLDDVVFHRFPTSRWRRYDKLVKFPAGIVALGDAVASFNPTYGQGMTMAALQARNLRRALDRLATDAGTELNRMTAKTIHPVWTINAIVDLTLHNASGRTKWWYWWVGEMFDYLLRAAETEPVLAEWFLRRVSLLDSLYVVPSPRIVGRTLRHNARRWVAERLPSSAVRDIEKPAAQPYSVRL